MSHTVPFFSNTPDDTHCYQAAIRMVTKYFWPNEEYSWAELEKITAKKEGLWTWPLAGMLWLQSKGAEVIVQEIFDHQEFIQRGGKYLLDFCGQEAGREQVKYSDIPQEIAFTKQAREKLHIEKQLPTIDNITSYLKEGYLVICNVNSHALNNEEGYSGHFVVVIGYETDCLYLHDPGLPPQENRKVSWAQFTKAWAYPDEKTKNLAAIRLNKPT